MRDVAQESSDFMIQSREAAHAKSVTYSAVRVLCLAFTVGMVIFAQKLFLSYYYNC